MFKITIIVLCCFIVFILNCFALYTVMQSKNSDKTHQQLAEAGIGSTLVLTIMIIVWYISLIVAKRKFLKNPRKSSSSSSLSF